MTLVPMRIAVVCLALGCTGEPDPVTGCVHEGFDAAVSRASVKPGQTTVLELRTATGSRFDLLTLELRHEQEVPEGPFTWTLGDDDYRDCAVCLLAWEGCTEGVGCDRAFLAFGGLLDVTAADGPDSRFVGNLTGAQLGEVLIEPSSLDSYFVPDGGRWCLGTVGFDVALDGVE